MEAHFTLPNGTSMFRRGHILTIAGMWDHDLMDELEYGLNGLRQVLPRAHDEKRITLHLFNCSMAMDAVSTALSLVRRTFMEDTTHVSVIAEGTLSEAGLLFLAGNRRGFRKLFSDARVEMRLRAPRVALPGGFDAPLSAAPSHALLQMLPSDWQKSLANGDSIHPTVTDVCKAGLADKLIERR